ncbi:GM23220 [Drosophila sechellia]|uniref:GM23220 n=1 Tax=Drosophila sechellia TaxID=7238 RepID=B4IM43_DROSE|nr:GM23220 [Drosophila sechellia]
MVEFDRTNGRGGCWQAVRVERLKQTNDRRQATWLSAARCNEKFAERTVVGRRQAGRFGRTEFEVPCNKKFDGMRR